jgi:two-component system, sensor histidine kinase and response regulator
MTNKTHDELQVQIQYALVERLSSTQKRQSKLLTLLDECIFECDDTLQLTFTNPAWKKRLGYESSALKGMSLYELIVSDTQKTLLEMNLYKLVSRPNANTNTAPVIIELQLKLKTGSLHWFELRLVHDGNTGYIGSLFEIQQHKDIQAQLLQQQNYVRRLSLVASHTRNLVVITNREGHIEWVNTSFEQRTGYLLNNILGQSPGKLLQGEKSCPKAIAKMADAVKRGRGFEVELINYTQKGEPYWVSINTSPVYDGTGQISHFIAVQSDISESKASLKILQEAKYQAEMLSEAKSRFMANISHEIRTPLNAIIGSADILRDTGLTREQLRYTGMISTSSDALLSILDDVLTYSRFEAGRTNMLEEAFRLDLCLEEAIDIVSGAALDKSLSLILDVMPQVPLSIVGDKGRLRQVLINLLANAIKFTEKGEVLLKVKTLEIEGEIKLLLDIKDTGIGIAQHKIEQMFEPFMQSDTSSTREYGGSGLGLAICRQITEAMGGSIRVHSRLDHGSCFTVELPLLLESKTCSVPSSIIQMPQSTHCWVVGEHGSLNQAVLHSLEHYNIDYKLFSSCEDFPSECDSYPNIIMITEQSKLTECRKFIELHTDICPTNPLTPNSNKPCLLMINLLEHGRGFSYSNQNELLLNGPYKLSHLGWALELMDDPLVNLHFSETPPPEQATTSLTQYADKHVLIVEDNINNQVVLSQILAQLGCKIYCADHGQAALDFLANQSTDLILMDIQMPVMDGLTATKRIRASNEEFSQIPIIAVTANAIHGDRERFIQAGMNDYIAKPIDREKLFELLAHFLSSSNNINNGKMAKLKYTWQQLSNL